MRAAENVKVAGSALLIMHTYPFHLRHKFLVVIFCFVRSTLSAQFSFNPFEEVGQIEKA
jgi:hypothetical protein